MLMETTLTIEGIDADTLERLSREANRRGVAVSVLARSMLEQSIKWHSRDLPRLGSADGDMVRRRSSRI